jgi:hypothetical protein
MPHGESEMNRATVALDRELLTIYCRAGFVHMGLCTYGARAVTAPASPPHRRSTDFEQTSPSYDAERAADWQAHS